MKHRVFHIIVAAGSGNRFGSSVPKQFLPFVDGRPVLMTTLSHFMSRAGEEVIVVLSEQMTGYWEELCREHGFVSPRVVTGGATRHGSVANALAVTGATKGDVITVHDGARPVVGDGLIERVMSPVVAGTAVAVIPAVAVTDSLRVKTTEDGERTAAVDRSRFLAVQTPQAFEAEVLLNAFKRAESPEMTDEASVVEMDGHDVMIVDGESTNIKITRPGDIEIAGLYINSLR